MDSEETGRKKENGNSIGNAKNQDFNAGGNASDYDGGHPKDAHPDSEGRIVSEDDSLNSKKSGEERRDAKSFNTGGNDSDYDGGHPKDVSEDSPGHIDSKGESPDNT